MTAFTVTTVCIVPVVAGLATWQAVDVWRHSSLMASTRARWQLGNGFFARLLSCPYCLSIWVGIALSGWLLAFCLLPRGASLGAGPVWAAAYEFCVGVFAAFPLGLAGSKLANLCNDLAYRISRMPKNDREDVDELPPPSMA